MSQDEILWLKPRDIKRRLGISEATLRKWVNTHAISFRTTPGGHHRYDIASAGRVTLVQSPDSRPTHPFATAYKPNKETERFGAIYCRVSSHKQKEDLQRQVATCQAQFPDYKVYTDICSGLNYTRKALPRLLEHVQNGLVSQVVVAHKDRLARFGVELITWILDQHNTPLLILSDPHGSPEQELTEDLMAIVHVFSCRLNGKRRYTQAKCSGEDQERSNLQGMQKPRGKRAKKDRVDSSMEGSTTSSQALSALTLEAVPTAASNVVSVSER
jgi:predicted site-specific integrase-resolvase